MIEMTDCRVCHNDDMSLVHSLGDIAISDFTDTPQTGEKYPIDITFCNRCTLLQLNDSVDRDKLYRNYWYKSDISPVIRNDLKEIVDQAQRFVKKDGVWVDIGANDGTLLSYVPPSFMRVGVDPSINLRGDLLKHSDVTFTGYWEEQSLGMKADVVTAIACLYDLPDPNAFIKRIKTHLSDSGVFVSQLMTLAPMVETNDLGNFCHEHLEYYSYRSLRQLFEQNGLEIFDVATNNINGGSYRVFARHAKEGSVRFDEPIYGADDFKAFFARIDKNKDDLLDFVRTHRTYGFGASTKSATIMQYYGVTPRDLPAIVDINPGKAGKYTINTGIPVVDTIPEDCEYLWALPWGFIDHFVENEKEFRQRGGKFVVSTPEFKII